MLEENLILNKNVTTVNYSVSFTLISQTNRKKNIYITFFIIVVAFFYKFKLRSENSEKEIFSVGRELIMIDEKCQKFG